MSVSSVRADHADTKGAEIHAAEGSAADPPAVPGTPKTGWGKTRRGAVIRALTRPALGYFGFAPSRSGRVGPGLRHPTYGATVPPGPELDAKINSPE
jgi:hypothetical protein